MRIAILCHVRWPIGEPFQGGMEAHSWQLATGLTARGHDVVLFATGDSDPRFCHDAVLAEHYEQQYPWAEFRDAPPLVALLDARYAAACRRLAAGGFDAVHNNSLHRFPLLLAREHGVPTVTSLHVPPYDGIHWFVQDSVGPGHRLTVTATPQLAAWWPAGAPAGVEVLPNGIDGAAWPFQPQGDGTAAWCGRINPNKGPHLAIEAAARAGIPLTLYGSIDDPDYWDAAVRPRLGPGARYAGHLPAAALAAALGRASVLLFTPCWDEPFGLVAVEAMSCGLPVAAFALGAAREVIGEAGAFAPPGDVAGLAAAIPAALAVPRAVPRARVERLFGRQRWLERCEELYRAAARELPAAGPRAAPRPAPTLVGARP